MAFHWQYAPLFILTFRTNYWALLTYALLIFRKRQTLLSILLLIFTFYKCFVITILFLLRKLGINQKVKEIVSQRFLSQCSPSSLAITPDTSTTRNRWTENSLNATGNRKPETTRLPQRKPLSLHSSQRSVFSPPFAAWTVFSLFAYFSLLLSFRLVVSFCSLGFQVNLYGNTQIENAQITIAQFNGFLHCKHPSCDRCQSKESKR